MSSKQTPRGLTQALRRARDTRTPAQRQTAAVQAFTRALTAIAGRGGST